MILSLGKVMPVQYRLNLQEKFVGGTVDVSIRSIIKKASTPRKETNKTLLDTSSLFLKNSADTA
jgi:hypothetical protein